jgi:hypothetical protein
MLRDVQLALMRKAEAIQSLVASGLLELLLMSTTKLSLEPSANILHPSLWRETEIPALKGRVDSALITYSGMEESQRQWISGSPKSSENLRYNLYANLENDFQEYETKHIKTGPCFEAGYESVKMPGVFLYARQVVDKGSFYSTSVCVLFSSDRRHELEHLLGRNGICQRFIDDPLSQCRHNFWSKDSPIFRGFREWGMRDSSTALAIGYSSSGRPAGQRNGVSEAGLIALQLNESLA